MEDNLAMLRGVTIRRVAGVLDRSTERPRIDYYAAVVEAADDRVWILTPSDLAQLHEWPDDAQDMPVQILGGPPDAIGQRITNVVVVAYSAGQLMGAPHDQIFLVLDDARVMGVVPTQRGWVLHVEPVLTSPMFHHVAMKTLDGRSITVDELLGI
jgi:hypothetical protein